MLEKCYQSYQKEQGSDNIRGTVGAPQCVDYVERQRMRWLGHLIRMEPARLPLCLQVCPCACKAALVPATLEDLGCRALGWSRSRLIGNIHITLKTQAHVNQHTHLAPGHRYSSAQCPLAGPEQAQLINDLFVQNDYLCVCLIDYSSSSKVYILIKHPYIKLISSVVWCGSAWYSVFRRLSRRQQWWWRNMVTSPNYTVT